MVYILSPTQFVRPGGRFQVLLKLLRIFFQKSDYLFLRRTLSAPIKLKATFLHSGYLDMNWSVENHFIAYYAMHKSESLISDHFWFQRQEIVMNWKLLVDELFPVK